MQTQGESASRKLYEGIRSHSLEPGTLYTTTELERMLGKPIARHRSAIYAVSRLLERHDKRTLICVTGKGYRIAHPREVPDIVAVRLKRGERQIRKGKGTAAAQDLVLLTQDERRDGDLVRQALHFMLREFKRVQSTLDKHEALLVETEQRLTEQTTIQDERLDRLEQEIAALRAEKAAL